MISAKYEIGNTLYEKNWAHWVRKSGIYLIRANPSIGNKKTDPLEETRGPALKIITRY